MFDFLSEHRRAKKKSRLTAWLELFEPETRRIIEWWEEERRALCLSRFPNSDEHDAGFEKGWREIQSLQVEGHMATLWLYKPNGTFAATVDILSTSIPISFPGGPVMPRQELARETPEAAVDDLRRRIRFPNYNAI